MKIVKLFFLINDRGRKEGRDGGIEEGRKEGMEGG